MSTISEAQQLLQKYYGYSSFRSGQEEIIKNILQGRDTLGIMPTGGGKSVCYQIPALMQDGTTLVISPLISLMKDQVDSLESHGIAATYINSSLEQKEVSARIRKAGKESYKLLYIAPERLESERFIALLQTLPISMVAIDEAHCISQWGHDFRPCYLSIAKLIQELPNRPVVTAFTATATQEVQLDILRLLNMKGSHMVVTGFNRENLALSILREGNKKDFILRYIKQNKNQAGIVYAATRKEVEDVFETLRKQGIAVGKYHAGLSDEERIASQDAFLFDDLRVMVATNAFGMGIDKSNVRFVLHHNMPKTMEAYYQEAGRAGRDGEPSECILLFSPQDIQLQKFLIEQSASAPERKMNEYKRLQLMVEFCHTPQCLANAILHYFGERDHSEPCGRCGNCKDERELTDITVEAQKIFSCIRRMKERFGVSFIADVLKGAANKRVRQYSFDSLPTYGAMREYKDKEITDLIHVLVAEGYIALTDGQYPVAKLTSKAAAVLHSEASVYQRVWNRRKESFSSLDQLLFEQLRVLRKELSTRDRVPPYVIFPDSTLRELSEKIPTEAASMLRIKGVGEVKFAKY
ncbi:MAG TPA: DNA helicase RecQ, partial [Bacilli bacterium]